MKDQDLQSPNMLVTPFQSDTWYQNINGCQIFAHSIRPRFHAQSLCPLCIPGLRGVGVVGGHEVPTPLPVFRGTNRWAGAGLRLKPSLNPASKQFSRVGAGGGG